MNHDIGVFTRRRIISPAESYFAVPAAVVGGGWTPPDLGSSLRLWIKADTGTTLTGALIDSIADQSGNGFDLTSTGSGRPTRNATGYNSLPSIDFTAASATFLTSNTGVGSLFVPQSFTMGSASSWFFIGQMDTATASFGRAFSYIGGTDGLGAANDFSATGSLAPILRNTSTNAVCMYQAAAAAGASGSVSLNTNMRVLMVFDGANATLYVNNVLVGGPTSAAFTLDSTGVITLGSETQTAGGNISIGAGAWDGTIAEALVTNTALNSTERANLDAYAVARLGA